MGRLGLRSRRLGLGPSKTGTYSAMARVRCPILRLMFAAEMSATAEGCSTLACECARCKSGVNGLLPYAHQACTMHTHICRYAVARLLKALPRPLQLARTVGRVA